MFWPPGFPTLAMFDCARLSCRVLRCVVRPAVIFMTASMLHAQTVTSDTIRRTDATVVVRHVEPDVVKRYPYGVKFLRPEQLDSVADYADTDIVPIVFKRDKTDIIIPNAPLDSIDGVVNQILNDSAAHLSHVWIGGSASPEGPEAHNIWLGKIRAKRLYDYLKAHTSIPDSLIRVENLMEDWRTPLRLIQKLDFPNKARVVEIWNSQTDNASRKRAIKAIDKGATWEYLIDKTFRPARNARMMIVCEAADSIVEQYRYYKIPPFRETMDIRIAPAPILMSVPEYRGRFVALKTDLTALCFLVANVGVEFSFGRGFSLDLPFYYSPYDITSKFRVRIFGSRPELRYWLNRDWPGRGHFFGLNSTVAGFNVSFPHTDRFQDPERALWGLGLSYGYTLNFGKHRHWGIEFNIGAGYMNYHLDTFNNVPNGSLISTRKKDYWGITRVGITLTYKFWGRKMSGFKMRLKEVTP